MRWTILRADDARDTVTVLVGVEPGDGESGEAFKFEATVPTGTRAAMLAAIGAAATDRITAATVVGDLVGASGEAQ